MNISVYPPSSVEGKCLVLVGGSGDNSDGFIPLVNVLSKSLPNHSICRFSFSTPSDIASLLETQSRELTEVITQLISEHNFKIIDLFCTSQGAYSTIRFLSSNKYSNYLNTVIMYDPADYYVMESEPHSWSGSQPYLPSREVISDELSKISGNYKIHVVHLTLRNYGENGYLQSDFSDRGVDELNGYPRLSSGMVESIYAKIPAKNKGEYIEQANVPHAILRDGNIQENLENVTSLVSEILITSLGGSKI